MNSKIKIISLEIIRIALAFLFILAAIEKLKSPYNFALNVDAYQVFPSYIVNLSVLTIPWLELFIGFGILFKYKLKANLILYLILMIAFTVLIVIAIQKGLDIECGCFGESSAKVGLLKIFENFLIIIACLALIKYTTT